MNTKAYSVVKVIFTVLIISLPFIGFYLGTQYQTLVSPAEDTTFNQLLPKKVPTPTLETLPIVSDSAGLDQKQTDEVTSNSSVRQITYKKIEGWPESISNTGYSFQHPSAFYDAGKNGEELKNGSCESVLGNDVGGLLSALVKT